MTVTSPRASSIPHPGVPLFEEDTGRWLRQVAKIVNNLLVGQDNTTGTVTLTHDSVSTSTTLTDSRIGRGTVVVLVPTTSNASSAFGGGSLYMTYPNANTGAAVIHHAATANTDETFAYVLRG